jgi:hypothetical protein
MTYEKPQAKRPRTAYFSLLTNSALSAAVVRDQTGLIGLAWGPDRADTHLLIGSSNYEDGRSAGSIARVYDLNAVADPFPAQESSSGRAYSRRCGR